jgi:hypothetical protein
LPNTCRRFKIARVTDQNTVQSVREVAPILAQFGTFDKRS